MPLRVIGEKELKLCCINDGITMSTDTDDSLLHEMQQGGDRAEDGSVNYLGVVAPPRKGVHETCSPTNRITPMVLFICKACGYSEMYAAHFVDPETWKK